LDDFTKDHTLPHVVLPPVEVRDAEKGRVLSMNEYSLTQIANIQNSCGKRPVLVDFRAVRFNRDDSGSDAARLSEFLQKARAFGCRIIPVFDPFIDAYRSSVLSAHIRSSKSGGAIRIRLADLDEATLEKMLTSIVATSGTNESDLLLIVDLCEAEISDPTSFAQFTSGWLEKLHQMGQWKRVIVEASSFPRRNPAPDNGNVTVSRNEWASWKKVVETDASILQWAQFGDFGADHGQIEFSGGGRTITHVRYATERNWIVERGGEPTKTHDGSIRTVAKNILKSGEFFGEDFSAGDAFLSLCGSNEGGPGNAATWRFANMAHHITLAAVGAARLAGLPFEPAKRAVVHAPSLFEPAE